MIKYTWTVGYTKSHELHGTTVITFALLENGQIIELHDTGNL